MSSVRLTSSGLLALCAALALAASGCASYRGAQLYQSGTRALDRGEPAVAIADLEQAAALVPEASEVQNHLGLAYAAAGRDDEALQAFERAVEIDCENRAAVQNLEFARRRSEGGAP
jgi:lipoprotein NlpI